MKPLRDTYDLRSLWRTPRDWFRSEGREQRIKDYMALTGQLVLKRNASFLTVAVLAAFYYDPVWALMCYVLVSLTEILDVSLRNKAMNWDGRDPVVGNAILKAVVRNTALSAAGIALFVISIALQKETNGHFTALFFLFSASLFAAMYNSQMVGILLLRLGIYSFAFLFIAFLDVVRFSPPLDSFIWLEFFTTVLVLYYVFEMSLNFYSNYQNNRRQMFLIKQENRRTKEALEIKSQFVSVVSHELRTPLTSIKGSLDLINSGKIGEVSPEIQPLLQMASKNSLRLAQMIDELLDLQKMESGEMNFRFGPVKVNDLLRDAVDAIDGYASTLGIRVATEISPDAGYIWGDQGRLFQVLQNLMSNALKFSHRGGNVTIRTEVVGDRVRISVEDNGGGIPENAKEQVFGKFTQVDSSDKRRVGGTGLGLHISQQIMERHDATIDFVSELGVGSTFFMEFDRLAERDVPRRDIEPVAKVA